MKFFEQLFQITILQLLIMQTKLIIVIGLTTKHADCRIFNTVVTYNNFAELVGKNQPYLQFFFVLFFFFFFFFNL